MAPSGSQDFYQQQLKVSGTAQWLHQQHNHTFFSDTALPTLQHWTPIFTPLWVVLSLTLLAASFLVMGFVLKAASDDVSARGRKEEQARTSRSRLLACRLWSIKSNMTGTVRPALLRAV